MSGRSAALGAAEDAAAGAAYAWPGTSASGRKPVLGEASPDHDTHDSVSSEGAEPFQFKRAGYWLALLPLANVIIPSQRVQGATILGVSRAKHRSPSPSDEESDAESPVDAASGTSVSGRSAGSGSDADEELDAESDGA